MIAMCLRLWFGAIKGKLPVEMFVPTNLLSCRIHILWSLQDWENVEVNEGTSVVVDIIRFMTLVSSTSFPFLLLLHMLHCIIVEL